MDARENNVDETANAEEHPDSEVAPKTNNAPKNNWFKQPPRPPTEIDIVQLGIVNPYELKLLLRSCLQFLNHHINYGEYDLDLLSTRRTKAKVSSATQAELSST
ncbi:hypothetical protein Tco_0462180 [Tanacetum coccineum]